MNELTEHEIQALHEALEDEFKAWATYDQVISDFGDVRPFANIREAEQRHIDALYALFQRYGLPFPANPWPGRVPRFASLREACQAAVEAEIANSALYDTLLAGAPRPDITAVLHNLQRASQERHLPAFRRCLQRGGGGRRGARGAPGRCSS